MANNSADTMQQRKRRKSTKKEVAAAEAAALLLEEEEKKKREPEWRKKMRETMFPWTAGASASLGLADLGAWEYFLLSVYLLNMVQLMLATGIEVQARTTYGLAVKWIEVVFNIIYIVEIVVMMIATGVMKIFSPPRFLDALLVIANLVILACYLKGIAVEDTGFSLLSIRCCLRLLRPVLRTTTFPSVRVFVVSVTHSMLQLGDVIGLYVLFMLWFALAGVSQFRGTNYYNCLNSFFLVAGGGSNMTATTNNPFSAAAADEATMSDILSLGTLRGERSIGIPNRIGGPADPHIDAAKASDSIAYWFPLPEGYIDNRSGNVLSWNQALHANNADGGADDVDNSIGGGAPSDSSSSSFITLPRSYSPRTFAPLCDWSRSSTFLRYPLPTHGYSSIESDESDGETTSVGGARNALPVTAMCITDNQYTFLEVGSAVGSFMRSFFDLHNKKEAMAAAADGFRYGYYDERSNTNNTLPSGNGTVDNATTSVITPYPSAVIDAIRDEFGPLSIDDFICGSEYLTSGQFYREIEMLLLVKGEENRTDPTVLPTTSVGPSFVPTTSIPPLQPTTTLSPAINSTTMEASIDNSTNSDENETSITASSPIPTQTPLVTSSSPDPTTTTASPPPARSKPLWYPPIPSSQLFELVRLTFKIDEEAGGGAAACSGEQTCNTNVEESLVGYVCPYGFVCRDNNVPVFGDMFGFNNVLQSLLTMFVISTYDEWQTIMYVSTGGTSFWAEIFFVLFIIVGTFMLVNLTDVVLSIEYDKSKAEERRRIKSLTGEGGGGSGGGGGGMSGLLNSNHFTSIVLKAIAFEKQSEMLAKARAQTLSLKQQRSIFMARVKKNQEERQRLEMQQAQQAANEEREERMRRRSMFAASMAGRPPAGDAINNTSFFAGGGAGSPTSVYFTSENLQQPLLAPYSPSNNANNFSSPLGFNNNASFATEQLINYGGENNTRQTPPPLLILKNPDDPYSFENFMTEDDTEEDWNRIVFQVAELRFLNACAKAEESGNEKKLRLLRMRFYVRFYVVEARWFVFLTSCVTLANICLLATDYYGINPSHAQSIWVLNGAFSAFYTLELVIRLLGRTTAEFFTSVTSYIEIVVVLMSWIDVLPFANHENSSKRAMRIIRTFRTFRFVKLFPKVYEWFRFILQAIAASPMVLLILLQLIFIFSAFAMQAFGGKFCGLDDSPMSQHSVAVRYTDHQWVTSAENVSTFVAVERVLTKFQPSEVVENVCEGLPKSNFEHFGFALLTTFQVLTNDNWTDVLINSMSQMNVAVAIIYVLFMFIGNHIILSLLVAILLSAGESSGDEEESLEELLKEDQQQRMLKEMAEKAAQYEDEATLQRSSNNNDDEEGSEMESVASDDDEAERQNKQKREKRKYIVLKSGRVKKVSQTGQIIDKYFAFVADSKIYTKKLLESIPYKVFMSLVILLGTVVLALYEPLRAPDTTSALTLHVLTMVTTAFYVLDLLLCSHTYGFVKRPTSYLRRDIFNAIDFIVLIFLIVMLVGYYVGRGNAAFTAIGGIAALRPIRLAKESQGVRLVIGALFKAIPQTRNILWCTFGLFLIYGIFGVYLFGGRQRMCVTADAQIVPQLSLEECTMVGGTFMNTGANFDNIGSALITLFQLATMEGWSQVTYSLNDIVGVDKGMVRDANLWAILYCVPFTAFTGLFLTNVIAATIIDAYNSQKRKAAFQKSVYVTREQSAWLSTNQRIARYLPVNSGAISQATEKQLKRQARKALQKANNKGEGGAHGGGVLSNASMAGSPLLNGNNNSPERGGSPSPHRNSSPVGRGGDDDEGRSPFDEVETAAVLVEDDENNNYHDDALDDNSADSDSDSDDEAAAKKKRLGKDRLLSRAHFERTSNKLRDRVRKVVRKGFFAKFGTFVVLCNFVALCLQFYPEDKSIQSPLDALFIFFAVWYAFEALVKIVGEGWRMYFKSQWSRLEFLIALIAIVTISVYGTGSTKGSPFSIVVTMAVLRLGRLTRGKMKIEALIGKLGLAALGLLNVFALVIIFMFVFGVIGMRIFGRVKYEPFGATSGINTYSNFMTIHSSLMLMFQLMTAENWNNLMYSTVKEEPFCDKRLGNCGVAPAASYVYFFCACFVLIFFLRNLIVAVILDSFATSAATRAIRKADAESFYKSWRRYDPDESLFIAPYDIIHLIRAIPKTSPLSLYAKGKGRVRNELNFLTSLKLLNIQDKVPMSRVIDALCANAFRVPPPDKHSFDNDQYADVLTNDSLMNDAMRFTTGVTNMTGAMGKGLKGIGGMALGGLKDLAVGPSMSTNATAAAAAKRKQSMVQQQGGATTAATATTAAADSSSIPSASFAGNTSIYSPPSNPNINNTAVKTHTREGSSEAVQQQQEAAASFSNNKSFGSRAASPIGMNSNLNNLSFANNNNASFATNADGPTAAIKANATTAFSATAGIGVGYVPLNGVALPIELHDRLESIGGEKELIYKQCAALILINVVFTRLREKVKKMVLQTRIEREVRERISQQLGIQIQSTRSMIGKGDERRGGGGSNSASPPNSGGGDGEMMGGGGNMNSLFAAMNNQNAFNNNANSSSSGALPTNALLNAMIMSAVNGGGGGSGGGELTTAAPSSPLNGSNTSSALFNNTNTIPSFLLPFELSSAIMIKEADVANNKLSEATLEKAMGAVPRRRRRRKGGALVARSVALMNANDSSTPSAASPPPRPLIKHLLSVVAVPVREYEASFDAFIDLFVAWADETQVNSSSNSTTTNHHHHKHSSHRYNTNSSGGGEKDKKADGGGDGHNDDCRLISVPAWRYLTVSLWTMACNIIDMIDAFVDSEKELLSLNDDHHKNAKKDAHIAGGGEGAIHSEEEGGEHPTTPNKAHARGVINDKEGEKSTTAPPPADKIERINRVRQLERISKILKMVFDHRPIPPSPLVDEESLSASSPSPSPPLVSASVGGTSSLVAATTHTPPPPFDVVMQVLCEHNRLVACMLDRRARQARAEEELAAIQQTLLTANSAKVSHGEGGGGGGKPPPASSSSQHLVAASSSTFKFINKMVIRHQKFLQALSTQLSEGLKASGEAAMAWLCSPRPAHVVEIKERKTRSFWCLMRPKQEQETKEMMDNNNSKRRRKKRGEGNDKHHDDQSATSDKDDSRLIASPPAGVYEQHDSTAEDELVSFSTINVLLDPTKAPQLTAHEWLYARTMVALIDVLDMLVSASTLVVHKEGEGGAAEGGAVFVEFGKDERGAGHRYQHPSTPIETLMEGLGLVREAQHQQQINNNGNNGRRPSMLLASPSSPFSAIPKSPTTKRSAPSAASFFFGSSSSKQTTAATSSVTAGGEGGGPPSVALLKDSSESINIGNNNSGGGGRVMRRQYGYAPPALLDQCHFLDLPLIASLVGEEGDDDDDRERNGKGGSRRNHKRDDTNNDNDDERAQRVKAVRNATSAAVSCVPSVMTMMTHLSETSTATTTRDITHDRSIRVASGGDHDDASNDNDPHSLNSDRVRMPLDTLLDEIIHAVLTSVPPPPQSTASSSKSKSSRRQKKNASDGSMAVGGGEAEDEEEEMSTVDTRPLLDRLLKVISNTVLPDAAAAQSMLTAHHEQQLSAQHTRQMQRIANASASSSSTSSTPPPASQAANANRRNKSPQRSGPEVGGNNNHYLSAEGDGTNANNSTTTASNKNKAHSSHKLEAITDALREGLEHSFMKSDARKCLVNIIRGGGGGGGDKDHDNGSEEKRKKKIKKGVVVEEERRASAASSPLSSLFDHVVNSSNISSSHDRREISSDVEAIIRSIPNWRRQLRKYCETISPLTSMAMIETSATLSEAGLRLMAASSSPSEDHDCRGGAADAMETNANTSSSTSYESLAPFPFANKLSKSVLSLRQVKKACQQIMARAERHMAVVLHLYCGGGGGGGGSDGASSSSVLSASSSSLLYGEGRRWETYVHRPLRAEQSLCYLSLLRGNILPIAKRNIYSLRSTLISDQIQLKECKDLLRSVAASAVAGGAMITMTTAEAKEEGLSVVAEIEPSSFSFSNSNRRLTTTVREKSPSMVASTTKRSTTPQSNGGESPPLSSFASPVSTPSLAPSSPPSHTVATNPSAATRFTTAVPRPLPILSALLNNWRAPQHQQEEEGAARRGGQSDRANHDGNDNEGGDEDAFIQQQQVTLMGVIASLLRRDMLQSAAAAAVAVGGGGRRGHSGSSHVGINNHNNDDVDEDSLINDLAISFTEGNGDDLSSQFDKDGNLRLLQPPILCPAPDTHHHQPAAAVVAAAAAAVRLSPVGRFLTSLYGYSHAAAIIDASSSTASPLANNNSSSDKRTRSATTTAATTTTAEAGRRPPPIQINTTAAAVLLDSPPTDPLGDTASGAGASLLLATLESAVGDGEGGGGVGASALSLNNYHRNRRGDARGYQFNILPKLTANYLRFLRSQQGDWKTNRIHGDASSPIASTASPRLHRSDSSFSSPRSTRPPSSSMDMSSSSCHSVVPNWPAFSARLQQLRAMAVLLSNSSYVAPPLEASSSVTMMNNNNAVVEAMLSPSHKAMLEIGNALLDVTSAVERRASCLHNSINNGNKDNTIMLLNASSSSSPSATNASGGMMPAVANATTAMNDDATTSILSAASPINTTRYVGSPIPPPPPQPPAGAPANSSAWEGAANSLNSAATTNTNESSNKVMRTDSVQRPRSSSVGNPPNPSGGAQQQQQQHLWSGAEQSAFKPSAAPSTPRGGDGGVFPPPLPPTSPSLSSSSPPLASILVVRSPSSPSSPASQQQQRRVTIVESHRNDEEDADRTRGSSRRTRSRSGSQTQQQQHPSSSSPSSGGNRPLPTPDGESPENASLAASKSTTIAATNNLSAAALLQQQPQGYPHPHTTLREARRAARAALIAKRQEEEGGGRADGNGDGAGQQQSEQNNASTAGGGGLNRTDQQSGNSVVIDSAALAFSYGSHSPCRKELSTAADKLIASFSESGTKGQDTSSSRGGGGSDVTEINASTFTMQHVVVQTPTRRIERPPIPQRQSPSASLSLLALSLTTAEAREEENEKKKMIKEKEEEEKANARRSLSADRRDEREASVASGTLLQPSLSMISANDSILSLSSSSMATQSNAAAALSKASPETAALLARASSIVLENRRRRELSAERSTEDDHAKNRKDTAAIVTPTASTTSVATAMTSESILVHRRLLLDGTDSSATQKEKAEEAAQAFLRQLKAMEGVPARHQPMRGYTPYLSAASPPLPSQPSSAPSDATSTTTAHAATVSVSNTGAAHNAHNKGFIAKYPFPRSQVVMYPVALRLGVTLGDDDEDEDDDKEEEGGKDNTTFFSLLLLKRSAAVASSSSVSTPSSSAPPLATIPLRRGMIEFIDGRRGDHEEDHNDTTSQQQINSEGNEEKDRKKVYCYVHPETTSSSSQAASSSSLVFVLPSAPAAHIVTLPSEESRAALVAALKQAIGA